MDAKNFKAMMKEVIKESLREILKEEGLLQTLSESKQPVKHVPKVVRQLNEETLKDLNANRKLLEQSIGKSKLMPAPSKTFDPFAGTQPLTEAQASNGQVKTGALKDIDPRDPGVDVSSLIGGNKATWKALVGGKKK